MLDNTEVTSTETEVTAAADAGEDVVTALSAAAKKVDTVVTEAIPAAIVGAIDRIAATQSRIVQLLEAGNNNVMETMNGLSRAISNTDISAQRAAESAQQIEEQITPAKESSPDSHAKPEDIKELPRVVESNERRSQFWFGKAAVRHTK